jgi:hypothetical protein
MATRGEREPEAGDVYAIPVRDGGFAICRVLGWAGTDSYGPRDAVVFDKYDVELADWAQVRPPSLEEALAADALVLTFCRDMPIARERIARFHAAGFLPSEFQYLGKDGHDHPDVVGGEQGALNWAFLADEVYLERRYRISPDSYRAAHPALKKERNRRAAELMQEIRRAASTQRRPPAATPTLSWPSGTSDAVMAESRGILENVARKLREQKAVRSRSAALRKAIVAFNKLNQVHGGIIDTVVAEEIVLSLTAAGEGAGVRSAEEVIESVRTF